MQVMHQPSCQYQAIPEGSGLSQKTRPSSSLLKRSGKGGQRISCYASKKGVLTSFKAHEESFGTLSQFYVKNQWVKKQKRGKNIYRGQASAKVVTTHHQGVSLNNDSKMVYLYGDAGRGTNSLIKGHLRGGRTRFLKEISQRSYVAITPEFRISKLCCFCQELIHPKNVKKNGKLSSNLDTVICQNPSCPARKKGYHAISWDVNASVNMIMVGCGTCPAFVQSSKQKKNIFRILHTSFVRFTLLPF
ncbi:uncharacterized protein BX664DRAFT_177013 [Halteromyces radiatus]|uniref:uncharacterized protein n=1 Tax=Halteromyces radiatus TaxID=101107 RepID=UPI00221EA178|nr:uncharacterized protein BX664DRAFT_177013 [Halteromyces radiatus]KAI8085009.1 hypothetical protein BX664DRAFT_177013 [Halteromyces radiatus]